MGTAQDFPGYRTYVSLTSFYMVKDWVGKWPGTHTHTLLVTFLPLLARVGKCWVIILRIIFRFETKKLLYYLNYGSRGQGVLQKMFNPGQTDSTVK